jgi:transcription-repair coupling factor (superfamily II helicase)
MRDLEIRGAGRILGKKQSGHIDRVGYDLYCKLLEREMKKLKDKDLPPAPDPSINLSVNVRIPDEYAGNKKNRMRLYRRFGRCDSEQELDELLEELKDRYGQEIPDPVRNLVRQTRLRLRASSLGIRIISEGNELFILRFNEESRIKPLLERYPDRVRRTGDDKLYVYERTGQGEEQDHLKDLLKLLENVSEPHLASTAS